MTTMRIAFLGTGRMGTELALHLLQTHDLTVWNRTEANAQRVLTAGAQWAHTPQAAVKNADAVVTALFGPDTVRDIVIDTQLIPQGTPWLDATTVSPHDAEEFAATCDTYIATPVIGTLGPARAGKLGVYVGTPHAELRDLALDIARPWADPQRLIGVDSASRAATGKLLANLALAISAQGLREALALGDALGVGEEDVLTMLQSTGLQFIANMKAPFIRGERDTAQGDFTVDAIAKDVRLMIAEMDAAAHRSDQHAGADLRALRAALASLESQQSAGRGNHDFSAMLSSE
ncbi:NAD(P)-dependent oxidoreductase [Dermatophilus congolensis]|uniref:NAD(P)-dependent oxidoreductase n=1 Tax=Dermatophilus congolensis TaxID=1863 RepID=UPI0024447745|nr:NAD(P)-binding domain-containing protein [Dermatophilus congolensis]